MEKEQKKRVKAGGRVKGTPNKISSEVRKMIAGVVSDYYSSKQFQDDLSELEPRDRVLAVEKLTSYVTPKLQSTTLDVTEESKRTIEDKLIELSSDEEE
jgi:hypothetical protein